MPIKTKRWDDPREPDDGFRLLICRYRPRALKKENETWDPDLGGGFDVRVMCVQTTFAQSHIR